MENFQERLLRLETTFTLMQQRPNHPKISHNGIYDRYQYPILTADHIPLSWRFDFDPERNPYLLERITFNAVFNAGAIKLDGKYLLVTRVEGSDRKSFFAVAESATGTDSFAFWDYPVMMPTADDHDTNIYDMRLTQHQDGWIYGLFCTERRDPAAREGDQSAAIAQCAIARTKDLKKWHRLPDLKTPSPQQRNVVLHPEFVDGQYAFYTRPQDGFIEAGSGGGIGFGLAEDIEHAVINEEVIVDKKVYHTVYEAKNGQGPAPIKTSYGWLHLAHGVRNTAAGLRYVLYMFMTDLNDLTKVIYKPAGYFLAPEGDERVGDVSNVVFCNGWTVDDDGRVLIYYAASDTRMYVASSSIDRLIDYVLNTPADGFTSSKSVESIVTLIEQNKVLRTLV